MDCLICNFTLGIGKILLVTLSKDKIKLPQSDDKQILRIIKRLHHSPLNTRRKQPKDTNCTWLLKGSPTSEE